MNVCKLKKINGKMVITVNDDILTPMAFTMRPMQTGDIPKFLLNPTYVKKIGDTGINLFYIITDTEWTRKGANETFDREVKSLLKNNPNAYIMVRIGLHPPVEWVKEHPEECFQYNDGERPPVRLETESISQDYPYFYSLWSDKWREDGWKGLNETLEFIDRQPYADRVIGYFLSAGGTSEWYPIPSLEMEDKYGDCSPSAKKTFKEFLVEKYKTVDNLQKRYKNKDYNFDNVPIPDYNDNYYGHGYDDSFWREEEECPLIGPLQHNDKYFGSFLNVETNARTQDYYRAMHLGVAKSIIYFAKHVKEKYNNNKIVGAFYGSYGCCNFISGCTAGGVNKIINSGYIDFLSAPGVYVNRNPGGFTGQREMIDSFPLHNVAFMTEDDARTHLENDYFRTTFDLYDVNDSVNVLKREFGRTIADGCYAWWFDQHAGGGRYDNQDILALFKRQQEIAKDIYSNLLPKHNEIACIYDDESLQVISNQSSKEMIEYFRNYEVARIGAGCDYYFHNDLDNPQMPDYKLYIFFNVLELTDKERQAIKNKLAKNHATAIWVYAQGVINYEKENRFSPKNITDLIGIDIAQLDKTVSGKFRFNTNAYSQYKSLDVDVFYGDITRPINANVLCLEDRKSFLSPVFYANDDKAEILARLLNNNLPIVAKKDVGDFVSIFYGAKILSSHFVRDIAKQAGCHIFCESDDVLYTDGNYLTIHASTTGQKILNFPYELNVDELYENKEYGKHVMSLSIDMKKGQTLTFRLRREK